MTKASKRNANPFADFGFEEAMRRLVQTDKGELADAMAQELVNGLRQTRARVEETRRDIARGARTKDKKDRFRL